MLSSNLKSCFAYCAILPKDCKIEKKTLIQLWIAQDLIQSSDESENFEDIGNRYVEELWLRSFFQFIERDARGGIISFKLHNLMHDLAGFVSGPDNVVVHGDPENISARAYHMSIDSFFPGSEEVPPPFLKLKLLRTLLMPVEFWLEDIYFRDKLVTIFKNLRVLDLQNSGMEKVPSYIGELIHLRYLDVSMNPGIRSLPNSISNLLNLQTLRLLNCKKLEELPVDMRNMISLRHLEINSMAKLTQMPSRMGRLLSLQTLPIFIVGRATSGSRRSNSGLNELHGLNQLRGELHILNLENSMELDAKEAKLMNKQYLRALELVWNQDSPRQYASTNDDAMRGDSLLLEGLQPPQNLKELSIKGYAGREFPGWMMKISLSLPNLVELSLCNCIKCEHVPALAELNFLEALTLKNLPALEYFDKGTKSPSLHTDIFFPSLKYLSLSNMPNLVGWSRKDSEYVASERAANHKHMSSFPCLTKLTIKCCPKLRHLPLHQTLEEVKLNDFRAALLDSVLMGLERKKPSGKASISLSLSFSAPVTSKYLQIKCCEDLVFLPKEGLEGLSSLCSLSIVNCPELASLSQGMQFLTALEILKIQWCPKLNWSDDKDGMQSLRSLQSLKLSGLPMLLYLPNGLQHATALQYLCIEYCRHLKALPGWLGVFSSLQELDISCCPNLLHLSDGMQGLTALWKLRIEQCPQLNLSKDGLGVLCSLQSVKISGLRNLTFLPDGLQHATALQHLCIESCEHLETLPGWLGGIRSLTELDISNCPNLRSLPEGIQGLTALQKLSIHKCPHLSSRCKRNKGGDWPKIARIREIYVDNQWMADA